MDDIQVQKRDDNTLQSWDRTKLITSLTNAGISDQDANHLCSLLESWVKRAAENGIIRSSHIRGTIIEILKLINLPIASAFEQYSEKK
jgi:hypothetical protein